MSTAEFIERIKSASAHKTPLRIQGGASKHWYGQSPTGELLDTRSYAGIIDYDPTELVISAVLAGEVGVDELAIRQPE